MRDRATRRSFFRGFGEFLRRVLGGRSEPELPGDPYANRTVPVRRGPHSRSGAAALVEPEEEASSFPSRRN